MNVFVAKFSDFSIPPHLTMMNDGVFQIFPREFLQVSPGHEVNEPLLAIQS